ncbi:MAG: ATP-binding protein, partial [Bryobacteraceae bacterium]
PGCPLALWQLVVQGEALPGMPVPLSVDGVVVEWLMGELRMDARLVGLVRVIEPRPPLDSWPLEDVDRHIRAEWERGLGARIVVTGLPSGGRRTFAAITAARFGLRALAVDTSTVADNEWNDVYTRAQRLAILGGTALVWHGTGLHRTWPTNISPAPLQFIACDGVQTVPAFDQMTDKRIDLPLPAMEERRNLWKASVPQSSVWPAHEFEALVARYRLCVGDIVSAGRRNPASAGEAAQFCREATRHMLGDLARPLDCPFQWDDLVVTGKLRESLVDLSFEARDRTSFWDSGKVRRLFPRGTGLVALFNGPPGTGKTMAAQVIAADLQMDVIRVDLASVVSKYIGETAKHLSRIFTRAARMNAVLLFDEADALFSKRTDVRDSHDRYANTDTSYLLQLLEEYEGVVILATNKKQNIDPAFVRRVRYVLDFPRPEAAERRAIWRKVVADLAGAEAASRLERSIELLAANIEISGAQIKNSVLDAVFAGRRKGELPAMAHLIGGVERELAKEGRALSVRERERLIRDA